MKPLFLEFEEELFESRLFARLEFIDVEEVVEFEFEEAEALEGFVDGALADA